MSSDPFDGGPAGVEFDPSAFSGVARLFPLPTPTLYPRVVQPLHLFEERYLALIRDALDGDGLIAMAVLRPGWEQDYAGRPPLEPVACLGKVLTHHRLENGRYNVLLAGVARVRLLEEVEPPEAFRRARVELLTEIEPAGPAAAGLHGQLATAFRAALPNGTPPEPLLRVFDEDTPLGLLADLAAYTLPLPREVKQAALAEPDVYQRSQQLIDAIESGVIDQEPPAGSTGEGGFPPPFSPN